MAQQHAIWRSTAKGQGNIRPDQHRGSSRTAHGRCASFTCDSGAHRHKASCISNDRLPVGKSVANGCKFIVISHLEVRIVRLGPIAAPKQTERLSVSSHLFVFGIDRLRGHPPLIDQIVDILSFLIENSDIPGDPFDQP